MKRIIDGVNLQHRHEHGFAQSEYETDYNHLEKPAIGTLYQTRGGAFFVHEAIDTGWARRDPGRRGRSRFVALRRVRSSEMDHDGPGRNFPPRLKKPPEATAETEASATAYVRLAG